MARRGIYYDTETTGLRAGEDRIIEIAAYDPKRDATFESLVNPGVPIPPASSAIHHITDEMVVKAPSFEEVALKFVDFCEGDVILIAHNNDQFDQRFVKAEFERVDIPLPDWSYLDTLKWARKYRSDLPRHSLQFLRETFGFEQNNAHRALDDVIILHQVFQAMIGDLSLETAYELMQQKSTLQRMPFGKHRGQALGSLPKSYLEWLKRSGALDKPENGELKEAIMAL